MTIGPCVGHGPVVTAEQKWRTSQMWRGNTEGDFVKVQMLQPVLNLPRLDKGNGQTGKSLRTLLKSWLLVAQCEMLVLHSLFNKR